MNDDENDKAPLHHQSIFPSPGQLLKEYEQMQAADPKLSGQDIYKLMAEKYGGAKISAQRKVEKGRQLRRKLEADLEAMDGRDRIHKLAPQIQERLKQQGITSTQGLHSGWLKNEADEFGNSSSLYFYLGQEESQLDLNAAMDVIIERCQDIEALPPQDAPKLVEQDTVCLYGVADWHFGAKGYGEQGKVYDRHAALLKLRNSTLGVHKLMPPAAVALVVWDGDTFHNNDYKNRTPKSGHPLQVEGTPQENLGYAVTACIWQVRLALQKHRRVEVAILKGNHDPDSIAGLVHAVKQRFRDEPRVKVWTSEDRYYVFRSKALFLAFHHGDGLKPRDLAEQIPYRFRHKWDGAEGFYLYTAHTHHIKADTFGGMNWSQMPALCGLEGHAADLGYCDTAGMEGAVFNRRTGARTMRLSMNA